MNGNVAILSDIHGNVHALQAVLEDMEDQHITEQLCLGDIVGYGAFPGECIDLIRQHRFETVLGNHDAMVCGTASASLEDVNATARAAILWTKQHLNTDQTAWLTRLSLIFQGADYDAAHASLHQPAQWPYVLSADMAALHFTHQTKPVCFIGHTHQPAIWTAGEDRTVEITCIENLRTDRRQLVNVGSVGQPRDRDERACYAVYRREHHDIWWRRVPYDIEAAQKGIVAAGLPATFAHRLSFGR